MRDRYDVVTKLLQENGLTEWHVVRPTRGDVSGEVLIQHASGKRVIVPITQANVDDLSDQELMRRIRNAILES